MHLENAISFILSLSYYHQNDKPQALLTRVGNWLHCCSLGWRNHGTSIIFGSIFLSSRKKKSLGMRGIISQIKRYRSVLVSLVKDISIKFKLQLSLVAASSAIGSAGYVSAFGVGYLYIKSVESGKVPDHPLLTRFFDTPSELLLVLVPSIGLLVIGAALIEYWGNREVNKVAWRYSDYCVQRIVKLVSRDGSLRHLGRFGNSAKVEMLSLIMKESRLCGIAARLLSRGLGSLAALPVIFVVLVWLSPGLTLLTIIFGTLGIAGYYRLSLRGANFRKLLEHYSKDARIERLNLVSRALYGVADIKDKDSQIDAAFEHGASNAFGQAFAGQRNALEASNLLSKILIAIILMLVFVLANNQVMSGQLNWGQLLVYVGALQMFAVRLIGAARVVVSINRFYPSISRYWEFVDSFSDVAKNGKKSSNKTADVVITLGDGQFRIVNKEPLGILMPLPVGKDDASQFINLIHHTNSSDGNFVIRLLNPVQADINASLDDYFGLCTIQNNQLIDELKAWSIEDKRIAYLVSNRSKTFRHSLLAKLSEYEVLSLSLIAVQHDDVDLIIISHELITDFDVAQRQLVLDQLRIMNCQAFIAFVKPDESVSKWVMQGLRLQSGVFDGLFSIHHMIEKGWHTDKKGTASLMDMALDNTDEEF